ncbi:MAG: hypothetical protein FIA94_02920 [Nitrospirae bacterium]|nr:hypothetical protein [Nitrospirota bacterium]
MQREELVQRVCAGYCSFYKPEKTGELACNGFMLAQKLFGQYRDPGYEKGGERPGSTTEHALFRAVCRSCPFFENDCDFALWKRGGSPGSLRSDVHPCGGLLFLTDAVDRGRMDIQAIYRVI